jgi:hypothetical protein
MTTTNIIDLYFHCARCEAEEVDPEHISVGLDPTAQQVQVWCEIHQTNIVTVGLDAESQRWLAPIVAAGCAREECPHHGRPG